LQIVDFTAAHIERAALIVKQNYETERGKVPALPPVDEIPDLMPFAENGLGVAAVDGGMMLGFLCCYGLFDNAFGISGLRGVFSPMHGNGTLPENRAAIYARLYQAAGAKWMQAGAASHAACLYAHDTEGLAQFFRYGFGMRTVDAIRRMDGITAPPCDGYTFSKLAPEDALKIMPLDNMLHRHCSESPFFMYKPDHNEDSFLEYWTKNQPACIAAGHEDQIVAYILAELNGETFIKDKPGYHHISAAYCLPEHRGKGLHQYLLKLMVQKLKAQGYTYLGTDFESFNPSGVGFWLKYFDAYAYGVVRRIDESMYRQDF
jgi:ribosomal protein S18 acetylase RimI-like enzyme